MVKYIRSGENLIQQDKSTVDSATIQIEVDATLSASEKVHKLVESILSEAESNNKIGIVHRNLGDRGPTQESEYPVIYIKNDWGMSALKVLFFFRVSNHPDSDNLSGRNRFVQSKKTS